MLSKISRPFFLERQSRFPLVQYLGKIGVILLVLYSAFRLGFYFFFQANEEVELVGNAFYLGLKFDLRLIGIQLLLFFILSLFPKKIWKNKILLNLNSALFTLIQSGIILMYFTDFGHYAYLTKRLHFSIMENFENPWISLQMTYETYPVIPLILTLLLLTVAIFYLYKRSLLKFANSINTSSLFLRVSERLITFLIIGGVIYGKLSYFPLRWSEAYFSPNNFISQLTLNPVMNFFETLKFDKDDYDIEKVKRSYPVVSKFLGITPPNQAELNFQRSYKAKAEGKPNIVFIQLESLAANKTSVFDNPLNPTPHLNEIAKGALVYKKFFTPTEATARGVWATLTGMPDIANTKSSSRNPHLVDQKTILNQFDGYKKLYFLGGSANWGNIRSLFSNNIKDIEIYDEDAFDNSKRVDVWGLSDLDLFKEAHKRINTLNEPFVAYIQSAGFHRPYTIPENNEGFRLREISEEQADKYGFISEEEFNSLRFQDHAFGHFMKLAKESEYFKNTIFVIYGDHGVPAGKESLNVPKGYYQLRLGLHHTPFVIYWPSKIPPRVDDKTLGGLQDILPTVSSLAGSSWITQTLGRDLRAERTPEQNYTFVFSWQSPITTGLVGEKFYLEHRAGESKIYEYESEEPLKDLAQEHPTLVRELDNLRHGLYETIKYLRYKNRK